MFVSFDHADLENPLVLKALRAMLAVDDASTTIALEPIKVPEAMLAKMRAISDAINNDNAALAESHAAALEVRSVEPTPTPPAPPAPAPAATAPTAPPPPPPAPLAAPTAGSDMFDSEGFPWDARIHSETRNRNADGTWRIRRGVDKDLVSAIRTEFKNGAANAAEIIESEQGAAQGQQNNTQPIDTAGIGFGQDGAAGVAPPPPAPVTSAAPPPPPAPAAPATQLDGKTWPAHILGNVSPDKGEVTLFMEYAMGLISSGTVTSERIMAILQKHGMQSLVVVGSMPHLIPAVVRDIEAEKAA